MSCPKIGILLSGLNFISTIKQTSIVMIMSDFWAKSFLSDEVRKQTLWNDRVIRTSLGNFPHSAVSMYWIENSRYFAEK